MVDDPNIYTAGMEAAKLAFETIRGALGILKDAKDVMPKGDKASAVSVAIDSLRSSLPSPRLSWRKHLAGHPAGLPAMEMLWPQ
jgi:hypothetical protein